MQCPSSIKVLGSTIQIKIDDSRTDVWGEWDGATNTILLTTPWYQDRMAITFLHEWLHCCDDLLGLNLKHSTVYGLSQVLWAVLLENPKLRQWLIHCLNNADHLEYGDDDTLAEC